MLGVRLDPDTERRLEALARRTRRSKSDIVREVVARHLREHDETFLDEARRQSLHASAAEDGASWAFLESIEAEDARWN